ncbi:hypothetical protein P691DRAFT_273105 [Macrolepiota fuliginosa MF-IS2]|uniref:Uncharacterized protein n=1 Tax=Macrolepiota fuliginosa MF-IS2 TaxID=1400762 RepID=A0A9P5X6E9_9AGAR|nr:hypothetical protein P691DRAFT_273105 [Macrolepiota fuliginosa MF-IS2]
MQLVYQRDRYGNQGVHPGIERAARDKVPIQSSKRMENHIDRQLIGAWRSADRQRSRLNWNMSERRLPAACDLTTSWLLISSHYHPTGANASGMSYSILSSVQGPCVLPGLSLSSAVPQPANVYTVHRLHSPPQIEMMDYNVDIANSLLGTSIPKGGLRPSSTKRQGVRFPTQRCKRIGLGDLMIESINTTLLEVGGSAALAVPPNVYILCNTQPNLPKKLEKCISLVKYIVCALFRQEDVWMESLKITLCHSAELCPVRL